jgi:hypothetical protein
MRSKSVVSAVSTLTGNPTFDLAVAVILGGASAHCFVSGNWFAGIVAALSLVLIYPTQTWAVLVEVGSAMKRRGMNPTLLLGLGCGVLFTALSIFSVVEPAHAQFLNNAETFIKNALGSTGTSSESLKTMIGLAFTLIRLAFLVYMAIAIIQIVQKGRDGEDIQTIARTPVIVAACVFIGDALAGMIVGTGTPAAG